MYPNDRNENLETSLLETAAVSVANNTTVTKFHYKNFSHSIHVKLVITATLTSSSIAATILILNNIKELKGIALR